MPCKMCLERGKTWTGDDPKCYFDNLPNHVNWRCATLDAIRRIPRIPSLVQIQHQENEQTFGTIYTGDIQDEKGYPLGTCLYIEWYKDRGRVEGLWILGDVFPPKRPTEEALLAIIKHYKEL